MISSPSVRAHVVTAGITAAVCFSSIYVFRWLKSRRRSTARSITHVLPDDKLIPVKLDGEDAFGCSEVLLPESFLDKYVIGKQLGSGFSGVVFAVSPRLPQDLAVKIINKAMLEPDRRLVTLIEQEVALLKSLSHPHILRLYEVLETKSHIFIVTERAMGGDLYEELIKRRSLPEDEARLILRQIVEAVMYLHRKGIIHRDIKPENILLETSGPSPLIKLCDFGLAKWFGPPKSTPLTSTGLPQRTLKLIQQPSADHTNPLYRTATIVGSELYQAPEVCGHEYSFQIDYYSIGIVLHFMLSGYVPDHDEIATCDSDEWSEISQEAKDVVLGLLQKDPTKRMTGVQVLYSPWMQAAALPSPGLRPQLARQSSSTMAPDTFQSLPMRIPSLKKSSASTL